MQRYLRAFLALESASGILLFAMAVLALVWANSPYAPAYHAWRERGQFLVNEGFMSLFFLLIGLELKRHFLAGEFFKPAQFALTSFAALGGMLMPALIYIAINLHSAPLLKGWAIPVATDIAFAIGVLSLFGARVPKGLKIFLLALAIFDDLGAILIIAFFYTQTLHILWIFISVCVLALICILNIFTRSSVWIYLSIGILLWFAVLKSGIHPTFAGVLLALAMPTNTSLENNLHPFVAYLIMPVFALFNAGLSLGDVTFAMLIDSVTLGIILGLLIGKPVGVLTFTWLLMKVSKINLPQHTQWKMFYGVAFLCGIGFTMSLFLGTLSFPHENIYLAEVRLGVIIGSILSACVGAVILSMTLPDSLHAKE